MSTNPAVDVISPPGGQRSWSRILMLSVIFLSGGIVGFAAGGYWMRDRMNFMIRHPQQVMDRLFPQLQSELGLNDEQARKVEEIMRQRYASMESVRAEFVPKQMAQFEVLNNEVAQILNPEQKSKWSKIVRGAEKRHMPVSSENMPGADMIFNRLDVNKDGSLTEAEVPPLAWQKIKIADKDKDGKVTLLEYQSAFPKKVPD
jgi:hypothetical protein